MKDHQLKISVYKTNILEQDLVWLGPILNKISTIRNWNVDFEDCDHILRIESQNSLNQELKTLFSNHKLSYIELE